MVQASKCWLCSHFTGNNYAELAKKHSIHERTLHRIVKRVQQRIKEAADKRSRDLFND